MRFFLTAMLLSVACSVDAQDYCKQIKKETNGTLLTEYSSPFSEEDMPPVRVKRSISTDEDAPFDNFVLVFYTRCGVDDIYKTDANGSKNEKQEKKLTIVFDDNTQIKDDTVDVMHDFTSDRAEAIRYIYYPITPETAGDFTTKKISKFIIGGQERDIPADSSKMVLEYIKCIKNAK